MRVNKKAILDTIEWAKTALANGMRVPPVPTSQVTEDILFKRAVVVALWAFWKPEQFQRQQGAGRWKAETPTINKVLSLLQTIDNVPVLDVQVDNDGMLHVKLIGAGVEHTEEDVDGDDDPDALWYTFIYAAFTPDMIAKITGNREKKFATWGYVHSIGEPQFGLGVLKAKTSCVTVRKDGAARPVYGAVVALTNDELDKMLKVALRETGVPHVLATLGVTTKGVKGAQQMYVPVPAPGGAPNGGAGGTRDFEAQDADAAASVRKTVDSLMALPAAADTYLQLLKPQQGAATTLHGIVDYLPGFNTYLLNINTKTMLTVLGDFPVIAAVKFSYYCQLGHGPFRGIRAANEEVKNLKGAAAEQAARVTPSMEMLANEYNALVSTLPTQSGRTPAGVKSVLDSVADYLVKGILSCDDAHERAQRTGGTGSWLKGWAERLTELNIAPEKISAFNAAVITLMSNIDSALTALGQGAVFGVGASKPSVAEEVPTSTIAIEDPTYPLGRVPSGEVGTTLTLFHGSPYSNVDVSEAPLLYYTANIEVARAYALGTVAFTGKPPKGVRTEHGPTVYTVKAAGLHIFDFRRTDHRELYQHLQEDFNKRTEDENDSRLPRLASEGFISHRTGLPSYGRIGVLIPLIKKRHFDAIWIDEGSQGTSLAIFNPRKVQLQDRVQLKRRT